MDGICDITIPSDVTYVHDNSIAHLPRPCKTARSIIHLLPVKSNRWMI